MTFGFHICVSFHHHHWQYSMMAKHQMHLLRWTDDRWRMQLSHCTHYYSYSASTAVQMWWWKHTIESLFQLLSVHGAYFNAIESFNCATTIIMHPAIPAPDDQLPIVAFPERHQMVRYIKSTVGTLPTPLPSITHPSLYIVFHQVKTKCLLKTPHPLPYSSLLMNDTPSPFPPASPSSSFIFFNLNIKHMSSYHKQHFVALLKYIIHKDLIDIYQ